MSKKISPMSWRKGNGIAGRSWKGTNREYDLFKELTVGVVVVSLLVVAASAIFSSPDDHSVTLKSWATSQPGDFVVTANAELGGTSDTAGYGPPYNSTSGSTQTIGALDLQSLAGVKIPIDTSKDFVIDPLKTLPNPPAAIATWTAASSDEQAAWTLAYGKALDKAKNNNPSNVATGNYGPVPALTNSLLTMAKQGSLDSVLQSGGSFYNFNYTRSVLFLGDGAYLNNLASTLHLGGDQWGMMNETGNYPGQSWLWLFSAFYQVEPFKSLPNADLVVLMIVVALTVLLMLVPLIPGLRSLPKIIPIHRLIWRNYYKRR
ncbi:hypothetical protein [Glaciihabitans sp. UYNi722]|uniref:hypothetical protein n=1 Tax=Glaciihabitans sp. UYNi722 TaxID=3156344 RepID=UPI003394DAA6